MAAAGSFCRYKGKIYLIHELGLWQADSDKGGIAPII